jgi:hypothetical protein
MTKNEFKNWIYQMESPEEVSINVIDALIIMYEDVIDAGGGPHDFESVRDKLIEIKKLLTNFETKTMEQNWLRSCGGPDEICNGCDHPECETCSEVVVDFSDGTFLANIVWSRGEQKCAVFPTREEAQNYIDRHPCGGNMYITSHFYDSKQDLETVIEDAISDEEAAKYFERKLI